MESLHLIVIVSIIFAALFLVQTFFPQSNIATQEASIANMWTKCYNWFNSSCTGQRPAIQECNEAKISTISIFQKNNVGKDREISEIDCNDMESACAQYIRLTTAPPEIENMKLRC